MRQLGLGFAQYVQDSDEKYPGLAASPGGGGQSGWASQIYPYVKSVGVYACPDDSLISQTQKISFNMNYFIYVADYSPDPIFDNTHGANLSQFTAPASTFVVYEVYDPNDFAGTYTDPSITPITAGNAAGGTSGDFGFVPTRHDPDTFASNYVAADGHVKFLKAASVSYGTGSPNGDDTSVDALGAHHQVMTIRLD